VQYNLFINTEIEIIVVRSGKFEPRVSPKECYPELVTALNLLRTPSPSEVDITTNMQIFVRADRTYTLDVEVFSLSC
jgi:hypothetical protein